jgi:hypothetical protein
MPREYTCYFNDESWEKDIYFIIQVILDDPSLNSAIDSADQVLGQLIEQDVLPSSSYLDIITLDDDTVWRSDADLN